MKSIKVIAGCGSSALSDTPGIALFDIDEKDIDRIRTLAELAVTYELSEIRFTKVDAEYPDGDYDLCTPEVVISGSGIWISSLFSGLEVEASVNTQSFSLEDLLRAFDESQNGDIWIPGDDLDEVIESVCENAEEWGLLYNQIGYQVVCPMTGNQWNGRDSLEVVPYGTAKKEYKDARACVSGPSWELWPIYPDTFEEPKLVRG